MAGPVRIAILANAAQAKREFGSVESRSQKFGRALKVGATIAAAGLLVLGAAAVKAGQAAAEDEASQSRLSQTLHTAAHATDAQVASTEKWITKQGLAKGVADDQLRPAIAKLATATGSVTKAQKLASTAMDISTGSGKSLETVTAALAKAQSTGSVTALAKYGVATKDAAGKTRTLGAVTKDLATKYQGAAAKAAETTAGKQKILTVQMGELQEQIGAGLLPAMNKLATAGLAAVQWATEHGTAAKVLLAVLVGTAVAVLAVSAAMKVAAAAQATYTAVVATSAAVQKGAAAAALGTRIGLAALAVQTVVTSTVTSAAAAAQWALNVALLASPLTWVIIGVIAFVAAIVIAWKKSETFRNVITGAWNAIKKATGAVWDWVKAKVSGAINFIKAIFLNFTGPGLIIKHWNTIKAATSAAWEWVKGVTSRAWQAVVGTIRDKVTAAVTFVRGLKDRVTGIFSNAGSWLLSAGKRIIQGLLDGIGAMIGKLRDKLGQITSMIPNLKGPARRDARLLRPAGESIIGGLITGIESKIPDVRRTLTSLTREVERFDAGSPTATVRLRGLDAFDAQVTNADRRTVITLKLTADQISQLQRGRELKADLNAFLVHATGRPL